MGSSLPFSSNSNEPRNETDVTTDYEMRFARWKFDVRSSSDSPTHRITWPPPPPPPSSFLNRSAPRGEALIGTPHIIPARKAPLLPRELGLIGSLHISIPSLSRALFEAA